MPTFLPVAAAFSSSGHTLAPLVCTHCSWHPTVCRKTRRAFGYTTKNEQSAERAIWDEALNLAARYAFHGHDVLTNPRIQSITPWANLVASGKSCSPDEQLQYCFGGAAGADPSDAGLLPFAFVLYLLPYV